MIPSVRIGLVLNVCVVFVAPSASAQDILGGSHYGLRAQRCGRLDPHLDLTLLGVQVGLSTFADVQKLLGSTNIRREVGNESGPDVLCYRLGGNVIAFETGAMGGWRTVTAIAVTPAKKFKDDQGCTPLEGKHLRLATARGLQLGVRVRDLETVFGPSTQRPNDLLSFDFHSAAPGARTIQDAGVADWMDWNEGILVTVKDGLVMQFEVYQAITQ